MTPAPRRIAYPAQGGRRLTLAMIVKNEARTLERTLRTARPHVDEIVVVDTGSTDGTRAIAQRYADIYDEIVWPNSFSIARNYSFDLATGEWVMYLDGDEYIEDPAGWARILDQLRAPDVAAVEIPIHNLLPEDNVLHADVSWQERIFRNHPSMRFAGRVHNQIGDAVQAYIRRTGMGRGRVDAAVTHTGYALDPDAMKRKYTPRLDLLRAEYEQPRSASLRAYYGYQYGVALFIVQDFETASEVFETLDFDHLSAMNAYYTRLLAAQTAMKLKDYDTALVHTDVMLSMDRDEPIGYYAAGLMMLYKHEMIDGLLMLIEAFRVNMRAGKAIRFVLNADTVFRVLSEICAKAGMNDFAAGFRHFLESASPNEGQVLALLARLQEQLVLVEQGRASMEPAEETTS